MKIKKQTFRSVPRDTERPSKPWRGVSMTWAIDAEEIGLRGRMERDIRSNLPQGFFSYDCRDYDDTPTEI